MGMSLVGAWCPAKVSPPQNYNYYMKFLKKTEELAI